ncbi:MAG TPA: FGGY family carbohydrate kinase [Pseudomonadales bacterium]|nr:FGGY family carbohydrate kinase [Pseudomonadales bacterium]
MAGPVLAIDAGSTSVRALVVDADLHVLGRAQVHADVHYPVPGRVEQDAAQIWSAAETVISEALTSAGVARNAVAAIGVTSQRGNVVVWDAKTGHPVAPLVSWQDTRGAARAGELIAQGFLISHQMAAAKIEAVLDAIERGRERIASGALLWGNVDTYLAWRLSGGAIHAMDHGQACATGYYDYFTGAWNAALLEAQRLGASMLPKLSDTTMHFGDASAAVFGATCPITALVADQQSASIAEGCLAPGEAKATFGTAAALEVNTGVELKITNGTYPMVLWVRDGVRSFCIEGMVNTAGAMIDWAVAELGIAVSARELSHLAASVPDTAGAYVLPALQGLGAPHGDPSRRAVIGGISRATTRAHIARAVLEGIAFRLREVRDAAAGAMPMIGALRADGGASRSDAVMQIQADVHGAAVERRAVVEATALGAAIGAGIGAGFWPADHGARLRRVDRTFEPHLSADETEGRFVQWLQNCTVSV